MRILKFYADWCAPCKTLDPIFEEIELEYDVDIEHINIEDESKSELMVHHAIRSVPTVIFITDDEEIIQKTGAKTKREYVEIIENN